MLISIIAFAFAALLVVLGFIALLKQKTYLDATTQQPVQMDIPILGKVKTNYPAIIFVLLGFSLGWLTFDKSFPPRSLTWTVKGAFKLPADQKQNNVKWAEGTLTLIPPKVDPDVATNGHFSVEIQIEEGKSIEDVVQSMDYTIGDYSATIYPRQEIDAYRKGKPSRIATIVDQTIEFKPVEVENYNSN